jgi:hypothetical protein
MIPTIAPLSQVVTGLRVADETSTTCESCEERVEEGQHVRCRIERETQFGQWRISGCFCKDCQIQSERSGVGFVVGRLGTVRDSQTQSSWLVLLEPSLVAAPVG